MASGTKSVRTIALVGSAGAGKTSLAEALLFASGAISRQGSVETGLQVLDAELRSLSQGVADFTSRYDHVAELGGTLAQEVIRQQGLA